jgi:hypothetical protein
MYKLRCGMVTANRLLLIHTHNFIIMDAESIILTTAASLSTLGSMCMMVALYKLDHIRLFA